MKYKKSPIYRVGNKYQNLDKIIPLLPKDIKTFYDVFGGSGVVAINAPAKNKIYNELDQNTYRMVDYIKNCDNVVEDYYEYKSRYYNGDEKKFYEFIKSEYNKEKRIDLLWYCTFMSFSNNTRFNSKGLFNLPFGKRLSEEKLFEVNNFNKVDIYNMDYSDFIKLNWGSPGWDFWFFDPPYLQSEKTNTSVYSDSWNIEDEKELLNLIQTLHDNGERFMITNTIRNKGVINELLVEFIKNNDLNTFVLNETNNSNGKCNNDYLEVAIYNYEPPLEQTSLF